MSLSIELPLLVVIASLLAFSAVAAEAPPDAALLQKKAARFASVDLTPDVAALPASERTALLKLIEAARIMDALFVRQVWAGNEALLLRLSADKPPLAQARLDSLLLDKGPWWRLDQDAPFMPGVPSKPAGANFYPEDMTREQLDAWMNGLPAPGQAAGS